MLVKLHGTSGSGKSTVARYLMKQGLSIPEGKAYRVDMFQLEKPLYILGLYNSQCGGCDTLTALEQIALIHKYAPVGHVFYEGLLGSEYYGKLGEASERYGKDHVFAFLDTPIEICIARVIARRLAKGNTKPLNEDNTRNRIYKIASLRAKLIKTGRNVVDIDHNQANIQILDLFKDWEHANIGTVKSPGILDARTSENTRSEGAR
jgi:predicted ABC-type ATPase